ncbi:MAG: hypothetical protein LIO93_07475, partial [Bacteroidales bacterium]|nr:hypothetical protein [Bacteroidales bacterium]
MDNKKKIAFILRDLGAGGAQRVLDVLNREFIQKGYQVCVLLTDNKEHYAYKYSDKLEIISLPEWDRQHEKSFVFVNSVIEKLQRAAAKLYYIKRPELFSTRNYFKKKSVMVKHYLSYH